MTQEPSIPPSETRHREEGTGLSSSRSEFAASLNRRLESVLGALTALVQQPASGGRRDNFLRRVHALGASAKVLGFAAAGEILTHAEHQIRTSQPETLADDILAVQKQLHDLPTLVLRGPYSMAPPSRAGLPSKPPSALIAEPLAIVVWGSELLLEQVRSFDRSTTTLELTVVTSPDRLRDACVSVGPDVLLLDAQQGSITLLVDELAQAPELGDAAIIVVNVPDEASQGLIELGVRVVLPTSFSSQQLSRALLQARHAPTERAPSPMPLGEITLKDLAERLAQEIRQGLVDCTAPSAHLERIALGDGTVIRAALWSSLARIRDHVVEATDGRIRFSSGPEGAELLAPQQRNARSTRHDQAADTVDLTGRRILVVDDDPAVAWFVGGTLRAAGAVVTEIHDGADALALAYRTWPEIIVSDVMMPGLDGFALCHAVKRDVLLRDVPIVLLSWKEDLLFRMRDLGADADAYLRKEASGSTIVRRVKELLVPRAALERRLARNEETRGRLDGTTMRLLLELVANAGRPLRIAVRDAEALYDVRVRHGSLAATTRTLHGGSVEAGTTVIAAMLGISAGRFSVAPDREPCDPMFAGSLSEVLQPSATRARAAQRVLSGMTLGLIEHLTFDAHAFGSDLPLLPVSLRPIADELLRGTAPRQLLASGVASVQLLESLLSDVARRGAVKRIVDIQGIDLLEREIQLLDVAPSLPPPRPAQPPQFSFQLTPSPAPTSPTPTAAPIMAVVAQAPEQVLTPNHQTSPLNGLGTQPSTLEGETQHHTTASLVAAETRPSAKNEDEDDKPTALNAPQQRVSLLGTSSIVPTSKPLANDDVDWALELTWDSTPPPPPQRSSDYSEAPLSKPVTSGGFMRPAIAILERGSLQETPDLANAVVKAMSEVTPPPMSPVGRKDIATEPPPPVGIVPEGLPALESTLGARPQQELSTPTNGANVSASHDSNRFQADLQANSSSAEVDVNPDPDRSSDNSTGSTLDLESKHRARVSTSTDLAQHALHTDSPNSVAVASCDSNDVGKADVAAPPTILQPFALTPSQSQMAEKAAALPVVHQPPRPSEPKPDPAELKGQFERDPEDPVFPLVSAPSSSVDIQPSIEIASGNHSSAHTAKLAAETSPHPVPDRDTLRSPGETNQDAPLAIRAPATDSVFEGQQRSDHPPPKAPTQNASASEAAQDVPPSAGDAETVHRGSSTRPNTAPATKSPTLQPRPVGWIQALGLAALAGMVTFAATVPVASWVRKRQHPVVSEPPVVQQTIPTAVDSSDIEQAVVNANGAASVTQPPAQSPTDPATTNRETVSTSATASTLPSAAPLSAVLKDTPAPSDISLAPGQALIEVATGGGHAIFVDDAFVGRGPIRVITVAAGRHTLRTRLNGVERNDPVEISPGRLLRVSLEQAWK